MLRNLPIQSPPLGRGKRTKLLPSILMAPSPKNTNARHSALGPFAKQEHLNQRTQSRQSERRNHQSASQTFPKILNSELSGGSAQPNPRAPKPHQRRRCRGLLWGLRFGFGLEVLGQGRGPCYAVFISKPHATSMCFFRLAIAAEAAAGRGRGNSE